MRFGLHRNQNYGVLFEESKQIDAWLAEALSQICLSRHKTRHHKGKDPTFRSVVLSTVDTFIGGTKIATIVGSWIVCST